MEEVDGMPPTYIAMEELPEPQLDATNIHAETLLSDLFDRFQQKKQGYECLAWIYFCLDLWLFIFPLLLLQVCGATAYIYLEEHVKDLSVCIATLTTLLMGVQLKLQWRDFYQKCKQASQTYSILAGETYYRWKAVEYGGNLESLLQFWAFALNWERKIKAEAPPIPICVANRVSARMQPNVVAGELEIESPT